MKHIYALLIKFVMVTLMLWIILSLFTDLTFTEIIYTSVAVTILAYLIGDLIILPKFNNTVATISDIGLAIITILLVNYFFIAKEIGLMDVLLSSLVIGVGEWFFHKYIFHFVLPNTKI